LSTEVRPKFRAKIDHEAEVGWEVVLGRIDGSLMAGNGKKEVVRTHGDTRDTNVKSVAMCAILSLPSTFLSLLPLLG
jgi:hypothetical protein